MKHSLETAERNCLRNAPPRAVGKRAAVAYLARKNALHKLDTPVPILGPRAKEIRNKDLTVPRFLIWNRAVPQHREL